MPHCGLPSLRQLLNLGAVSDPNLCIQELLVFWCMKASFTCLLLFMLPQLFLHWIKMNSNQRREAALLLLLLLASAGNSDTSRVVNRVSGLEGTWAFASFIS